MTGGIPFMITQAMKAALHARGLTDDAIAELDPTKAHEILAAPDKREVREFVTTIVLQARAATKHLSDPGVWQMILVHPSTDGVGTIYRYALDDDNLAERMIADAISASEAGHNVYIEARTVRRGLAGKQRGGLADTVAVFALVVDSDPDKDAGWTPTAPTSLAIETSPGNAHFWFFLESAVDAATGQALGERLRTATNADSDTGNVCQPYRVAGTTNYPNKKKRERGRIVTWTRSLGFDPETLWTPERFEQEFPTNGGGGGGGGGDQPIEANIPAETLREIQSQDKGNRGQRFWNVMTVLKGLGYTVDGIVALFEKYPDGIAAKYRGRLRHQVETVWAKLGGGDNKDDIELVCASDVEMKPVDWLWSNHLARGKVTLLAGDSGLAKSLMSTDFAARLSKGGEWPDGDPAPTGNVVILSSEDAINDTIKPRLEAAGADQDRIFCLARVKTPKGVSRTFSLQTDLQRLGEKVRAIGNVMLVIIDPVTSYMGSQIDSHHTVEVRAVLEPVARFAEEFNVCVLGISHSPKAPQAKALNAVVGSGAFVHAPRLVFLAIEDPESPGRNLLLAAKNNIGKKAEGLGYRILDDRYVGPGECIRSVYIYWDDLPVRMSADEALAAHAEKRKGGSALGEAENLLRERIGVDGVSSKEIHDEAEALGISNRTLHRARKKLGVKAVKDSYAEGWRLHLDTHSPGWRDRH